MAVVVALGCDAQDQCVFFQLHCSYLCTVADITNLLAAFPPKGLEIRTDRSRFNVDSAVMEASERICDWLRKCYSADADHALGNLANRFRREIVYSADSEAFYALQRLQTDQIAKISPGIYSQSGYRVLIKPTPQKANRESLVLLWRNDGQQHDLRDFLILPYGCLPFSVEEPRTIHFVHQGVDIRDQYGNLLSTSISRSVTLPMSVILVALTGTPICESILELWERETGLWYRDAVFTNTRGGTPPSTAAPDNPIAATYYDGRQHASNITGDSKKTQVSSLKAMMPLQKGDMAWLFDHFLKEYYPADQSKVCVFDDPNGVVSNVESMWDKLQRSVLHLSRGKLYADSTVGFSKWENTETTPIIAGFWQC